MGLTFCRRVRGPKTRLGNSVGNRLEFYNRSSVIIGWHQPINFRLYNWLDLVIKDYISINVTIDIYIYIYIYIIYIYIYIYILYVYIYI